MARRTDRASIPVAPDVWLHESRTVEDGKIVKFRIHVQYEPIDRAPIPSVRYDSAHGGPHVHRYLENRDVERVVSASMDEALLWCERDLWENIDAYVRAAKRKR